MAHFDNVISALNRGAVIPFLGAGVNLFGRETEDENYVPGAYLPSGRELAKCLANEFTYESPDRTDLSRVSQYAATVQGPRPLYDFLGGLFDADYPINELHRFFARLPSTLARRGSRRPYQLIVTTNYDDVLEEAFREAKEPFDLVTYVATEPHQGKFRHIPHGALPREGASLIRRGEIKDKTGLTIRLRDGADQVSRHLRTQFTPEMQRLLEGYDSAAPPSALIEESLVDEINRLMRLRLFEGESFAQVMLAGEAKKLVDEAARPGAPRLRDDDVIRLNRFLLEEAYPHEIARSPRTYITIEDPNNYRGLPIDNLKVGYTVILKIHGAVDRVADRENLPADIIDVMGDSFVITEDDYINYLAHTDVSKLVPAQLKAKLGNSGFLFLGYGLRDWNLRVIMHRMWGKQKLGYASWAIQRNAEEMDKKLWTKRNVEIIETPLEEYIADFEHHLNHT